MPIDAVARHTGLSWHSVKALDAAFLAETVVPPRPELLAGIRYLGVDEVARAKGHDYLTLVYDLTPGENCGRILWVKEGRDAATLLQFLDALSRNVPEASRRWPSTWGWPTSPPCRRDCRPPPLSSTAST
jgi:transposase